VPDAGVVLDDRGQVAGAVDHGVVLHVRAVANLDRRFVTAQHRAEPHACTRPDLDLADQHRGGRDVRVGVHPGTLAFELEFHGPL